jgi:hypothetical protein
MPRPLPIALSMLVFASSALAQHAESDLHIDPSHTRHLHKHGHDHPTSPDRSRFHTSRSSEITLPLPNEEDAFFFVVYGDRTGGPDEGISILKDAVRDTNLLEPDFVWTVGDLIQGYNTTEPWMKQMEEYKGVMDELLCPWFPVAGNHDVYWRGDDQPEGEHEAHYEIHFGPLWYAFEHKDCLFITLYSDEGNPETGDKTFRDPENQRMSPEQFAWLKSMLEMGADKQHIFLSIHHPRWLKGGYGDDWDKVHAELVRAGNVSAVFAGHIHRMRYDPKDGIDYVALATVGGHQGGAVPEAGMLHHFNIVTVRRDQVAHASVPVGEMMDVREITGEMAEQAARLSRVAPEFDRPVPIGMGGAADEVVTVTLTNPTDWEVDLTLVPDSGDSRWSASPDHNHGIIEAGGSASFTFRVARLGDALDATFRPVEIAVHMDMLLPGHRYTIPASRHEVPLDASLAPLPEPAYESVLHLDGDDDVLVVPSGAIALPDGPLTLEAWIRPEGFSGRTGLLAKTESSEYGIFVTDGKPHFAVHLNGSYAVAQSTEPILKVGAWQHIAGVFDGREVRLYLDGRLIEATPASGARTPNTLPLMIGGDTDRRGNPMSHFSGAIDGVRLSSVARYRGGNFQPERRPGADAETRLLYHMDGSVGTWLIDSSPRGTRATLRGGATVGPSGD